MKDYFFEDESQLIKRKLLFWFSLSLILHLICAYFSIGYWKADEHFQILEFLNTKLNHSSPDALPWEYEARIRPWFQVLVYYVMVKPLEGMSPFFLSTFLRIFSALLSLVSMVFLTKIVFSYLKNDLLKNYWLVFSSLFWFMPFIHVRTSSENFSLCLFFIGLYYFLNSEKKVLSGLFLGFSFISRFQMGLLILPLYLYSWILKRRWELVSLTSLVFTCLLGILIDYWGYGEWVFTPWNYFKVNLLEGKTSEFGVDPWWYYFKVILGSGGGPLGLILLIATIKGWIKFPKNPITWICIFYFLAHLLVAHKEFRFLTPLFPLSIFYLVMLLPEISLERFFRQKIVIFFSIINFVFLGFFLFRPVRPIIYFKKYLYENASVIDELYLSNEGPYKMHGTNDNFLKPKGLKLIENSNFEKIFLKENSFFFATENLGQTKELFKNVACHERFIEYPRFVLDLIPQKMAKKSKFWALFYCENKRG